MTRPIDAVHGGWRQLWRNVERQVDLPQVEFPCCGSRAASEASHLELIIPALTYPLRHW